MEQLKIRVEVTGETLTLKELKPFLGKEVEILITELPSEKSNNKSHPTAAGLLSEYANPTLVNEEKNAWSIQSVKKHGNS